MTRRRRNRRTSLTSIAVLATFLAAGYAWTKGARVRVPSEPSAVNSGTSSRHSRGYTEKSTPGSASHPPSARTDQSIHVALGLPTDGDPTDDYLIDHGVYVVSYNPTRNVPNWAAWELDRTQLGHVRRKNDFRPDPLLPAAFYHVTQEDYHGTGYDRGHLCPSADREAIPGDNSLTFLMTNMQPQLHELNAGPWEKLEEHERELARRRDAELFIVAGGIFTTDPSRIGHGVAVPKASYKIIVQLRQGQTASDVKAETKLIAVVMPNEPGVGAHQWTDYLTSVDAIERDTGYDFLSNVPKAVQDTVESKIATPE